MKTNQIGNRENIAYLEENYGKSILPLSIIHNEYMPGTEPLEILFSYKRDDSPLNIKESFFKTIEHYNIFSSRLILIGHNKFALQYGTDGVQFNILPSINASFDNVDIDDINKTMVHVKTLPGEPLFAVTIIPVIGGVFCGISCSDAVADVFALILFFFAWKSIIEGNSFPLPSTQRLFKGKPISPNKIEKVFTPPFSELSNDIQNRVKSSNVKKYTKREYFSDEFLNEHKNKAESENEKYIISNNQIITSFLLKKYHNIILPSTQRIVLRNPINLREVHPDIDSMYIGNAFFDNTTEFTKDEIDKMSIYEIAYRFNESITNIRNEKYFKKISYLSKYGIEFKSEMINNYPIYNIDTDVVSSNLINLNDPESLGLSSNLVNILNVNASPTSFIILKEKDGRIFANISSRYPLK